MGGGLCPEAGLERMGAELQLSIAPGSEERQAQNEGHLGIDC